MIKIVALTLLVGLGIFSFPCFVVFEDKAYRPKGLHGYINDLMQLTIVGDSKEE